MLPVPRIPHASLDVMTENRPFKEPKTLRRIVTPSEGENRERKRYTLPQHFAGKIEALCRNVGMTGYPCRTSPPPARPFLLTRLCNGDDCVILRR